MEALSSYAPCLRPGRPETLGSEGTYVDRGGEHWRLRRSRWHLSSRPTAVLTASEPIEYQLGDRVLSYGSWGADVFQLQLELISQGTRLKPTVTSARHTRRVVTAFQLANGLDPTASSGPKRSLP